MHKNNFIKIQDVNLEKKNSWQKKIAITLDVDFAIDEVLEYTLDILEESKKPATIFLTHKTKLLKRMRNNKNWEIGIHPNFFNIKKNAKIKNIKKTLLQIKSIVPEAVSLRNHGLITAGRWLSDYEDIGINFTSNNMRWKSFNTPYYEINGITECPIYFADNCLLFAFKFKKVKPINISDLLVINQNELRVFNFHPIHIALNTENYFRYENTKHNHNNWKHIKDLRYIGSKGSETWFRKSLNIILK